MAAWHAVMIHFPVALWLASALLIFLRVVTAGPVGRAADRALPVFLVLGFVFGVVAYVLGTQVWPWEAISSTPMGRNHALVAHGHWGISRC